MRGYRGMLGSVARNVIGHVECSVLICKGKGIRVNARS
jgi:nucleotide-binding universal stress UspA family protein